MIPVDLFLQLHVTSWFGLSGVKSERGKVMFFCNIFAHFVRYLRTSPTAFKCIYCLICSLSLISRSFGIGDVIWAVNCGGESHTDIHGIKYQEDKHAVGISSDYGKSLMIQRVVPQDQILYQTERYHMSTFGYDMPVRRDGDYVLVLKFSEVWFTSPNQKVLYCFLQFWHQACQV